MTMQPGPQAPVRAAPRSWPERIASFFVFVLWISAGVELSKVATDSGWRYLIGFALTMLLYPLARWVEKRVLALVRR